MAKPTNQNNQSAPNVVIIYADDMGYGDLGANHPGSKIPTPHLDRLASQGMRFTDGHASSGICTPSRFALLTGQHHWRRFHDIAHAFGESMFEPEDFTLAKMFKSKGYNTAAIGKWHLGWGWDAIKNPNVPMQETVVNNRTLKSHTPESFDWDKPIPDGPLAQGFDYYFGDGTINFPPYTYIENDRVLEKPTAMLDTDLFKKVPEGEWECRPGPMVEGWDPFEVLPTITDKAVDWIEGQDKETPFFMYFSWPSPHSPIIPKDEYLGKSQAGPYGDYVFQSDAMVGRVVDALEKMGVADNTLIVFSSDNGAERYAYDRLKKTGHWSSEPLRGLKRDMWEGGHRVPFVITWPGVIEAGVVSDETISQVDLAATFAQVIGYPLDATVAIDSYNLMPLLQGKKYDEPLRTATVQNTYAKRYSLRQGDWMYIDTSDGGNHRTVPEWFRQQRDYPWQETPAFLFNLKDDVGQRNNLYAEHPEKVAQMKALLDRYVAGEPCAPHAN